MITHPEPLTHETINKIFSPWQKIIKNGESGSVTHIPKRDQLFRINQFIRLYKNKTLQYIPIDLSALAIDEPQELADYIEHQKNPSISKHIIFVLDADILIDEKTQILSYLDSLLHTKPSDSILYFFQHNVTYPAYQKKLAKYSSLYRNVLTLPYFSSYDALHFVKYIAVKFNVTIPERFKQSIVSQCGGVLWLIKEAVRIYSKTGSEQKIFRDEGITFRLRILFDELEPFEQTALYKIQTGTGGFTTEERKSFDHLLKTNTIVKKSNKYAITVPLFAAYIENTMRENLSIELNDKHQIIINNLIADSMLSKYEKKIMRHFLKYPNTVISRERLAEVIWDDLTHENYTDWALDQIIKRLRIKLRQIGLTSHLIKTLRNRGYIFNQQDIYGSNFTS